MWSFSVNGLRAWPIDRCSYKDTGRSERETQALCATDRHREKEKEKDNWKEKETRRHRHLQASRNKKQKANIHGNKHMNTDTHTKHRILEHSMLHEPAATGSELCPNNDVISLLGSGHSQWVRVDLFVAFLSVCAFSAPRRRVVPRATPRRAPRPRASRVDKRSQQKHLISTFTTTTKTTSTATTKNDNDNDDKNNDFDDHTDDDNDNDDHENVENLKKSNCRNRKIHSVFTLGMFLPEAPWPEGDAQQAQGT